MDTNTVAPLDPGGVLSPPPADGGPPVPLGPDEAEAAGGGYHSCFSEPWMTPTPRVPPERLTFIDPNDGSSPVAGSGRPPSTYEP